MNPPATSLTPSQQQAVDARGNVLVMAGAGTGKTHTLIARCVDLIRKEGVSLDEILIVTFTEAAATELKRRLRAALEKSDDPHLSDQLALFDAAHIGTLHGFCFKLVREHFHQLGLDPQMTVLDEAQARLLADETLEEQFNVHYEGQDEFSLATQELIKVYGSGRDEKIRDLILRLYHYIQTRADAEAWLARQIAEFTRSEPAQWREWYAEAIADWRNEWLPVLVSLERENSKAAECFQLLRNNKSQKMFPKILEANHKENYPSGKMGALRKPLESFFEEAKFLGSLAATKSSDPLAEDWGWVRGHMTTLLQLAGEFAEAFSARKHADGTLDFHDLEQFALKLLWDFKAGRPTEIAQYWRKKLRFVFVDEYQDINAAQDRIICALAREGNAANRFLVGDVKQSIYRFRLADPKIFRAYSHDWRGKTGQTVPLTENFRSRESLLGFVNSLFAPLMHEEIGGVRYDDEAALKFGSPEKRAALSSKEPRTELLLRLKAGRDDQSDSDDGLSGLDESEKEARMLARRLVEMRDSGHEIWDEKSEIFRAAEWRDMAVLLRSPAGKAEIFAKQFENAGIPLHLERGGFYDSSEISDLLSLLQLLDNPLQDVPLIAVLRSPLVGCSLDELAEIRMLGSGKFWFALNQAATAKSLSPDAVRKIEKFLDRFRRWRKIARQASLSQCLEEILTETHYADWLQSCSRGSQQCANLRSFATLAGRFDDFQRHGLLRFLRFVEAQREFDSQPEVASAVEENAVRLMSIHQSKGLEFPIVAVPDLAKKFNEQDLNSEIILDERFGLSPRVKPPNAGGRYPSLANWLAKKNQRRELRGEEMRLLYVALTRARDTLLLSGSITGKQWEAMCEGSGSTTTQQIVSARSYLDWLTLWFRLQPGIKPDDQQGELPYLSWWLVNDQELTTETTNSPAAKTDIRDWRFPLRSHSDGRGEGQGEVRGENDKNSLSPEADKKLRQIVGWRYGFEAATKQAAKSSVTALRRAANEEQDDEAVVIFPIARRVAQKKLSAADTGLAHHKFLQHFNLDSAADLKSLEAEAQRLEKDNYLTADESTELDLKAIAAFWGSEIGGKIRGQPQFVRRELPFTARFAPRELDKILRAKSSNPADGFVIVQGVADLVVLLPGEIWVVDFKTDDVNRRDLPDKTKLYTPQLKLYGQALEKVYSRPVTNRWLHFLAVGQTEKV
jgi:ATP-dependent helicase/nuclease subunit A